MKKKFMILLLFTSLTVTLSLMSHTYSRYLEGTNGMIESSLATWQVLVNEQDIVSQENSVVTFQPIIIENTNTANNTFAPSSKGYFDIEINPENVGLSFRYSINIETTNETIQDLRIEKYEFIDNGNVSNETNIVPIENNIISNTIIQKNHPKFSVRIYFEWYEGDGETMNDEADTVITDTVADFEIKANISLEQVL